MGDKSYRLGIEGEEIALKFLTDKGFEIIAQNFRTSGGEIDIIAKDKELLVFVEVKYYSAKSFFPPIFAVSRDKIKSIIKSAKFYIHSRRYYDLQCRFDVVAIFRDNSGNLKIDHIIDAFSLNNR